MILENSCFMERERILKIVNQLNSPSSDTIPFEWEISLVNAFSHLGTVRYEANFGGQTRPDIHFLPTGSKQPMVADVFAVSDKGLDQANPFEPLLEQIGQKFSALRRRGISGHLAVRVGAISDRVYKGSEPTTLRLPQPNRFNEVIFDGNFSQFLKTISDNPDSVHTFAVKNAEADVSIRFTPNLGGTSAGHPSYTAAYSLRDNHVLNALRRKARKLKQSGFSGTSGIILCDGGCEMLRSKMENWSTYSLKEIIAEFFRIRSSVDFVLAIWIEERPTFSVESGTPKVQSRLYTNPRLPDLNAAMLSCLSGVCGLLPAPYKTPQNARHHLQWLRKTKRWHEGESFYGGMTVSDRKVEISARVVLELLSGKLDSKTFSSIYRISKINPFQRMLEQGRVIVGITLRPPERPDDDDEWLEFEFGEPDPSISPFQLPSHGKKDSN
jgi:hypothetical protein